MTSQANTLIVHRVEVRSSRKHQWVSRGTFETRAPAREKCATLRPKFGFGNTRVRRIEIGKKP